MNQQQELGRGFTILTAVVGGVFSGIYVFLVIPVQLVSVFIRAAILMLYWEWFAVPVYSVPSMPFTLAAGVILAYSLVRNPDFRGDFEMLQKQVEAKFPETAGKGERFFLRCSYAMTNLIHLPLLFLLVGWIVKQFM